MKSLLILGAGQYGQVVRELAQETGLFHKIDFLDDRNPVAVGPLSDYARLLPAYECAVVAMGNPQLRLHWLTCLAQAGFALPALVHPRAWVSPTAQLGAGTVVEAMAVVNTEAVIGKGGLLCAGCIVNHNAVVAEGCQIDCGAVVSAGARVPAGTKVPSGTVIS